MNFDIKDIPPVLGWILIVLMIALPTIIRLVKNLYRAYRIRQHKKRIPGPLLGVIYPDTRKK